MAKPTPILHTIEFLTYIILAIVCFVRLNIIQLFFNLYHGLAAFYPLTIFVFRSIIESPGTLFALFDVWSASLLSNTALWLFFIINCVAFLPLFDIAQQHVLPENTTIHMCSCRDQDHADTDYDDEDDDTINTPAPVPRPKPLSFCKLHSPSPTISTNYITLVSSITAHIGSLYKPISFSQTTILTTTSSILFPLLFLALITAIDPNQQYLTANHQSTALSPHTIMTSNKLFSQQHMSFLFSIVPSSFSFYLRLITAIVIIVSIFSTSLMVFWLLFSTKPMFSIRNIEKATNPSTTTQISLTDTISTASNQALPETTRTYSRPALALFLLPQTFLVMLIPFISIPTLHIKSTTYTGVQCIHAVITFVRTILSHELSSIFSVINPTSFIEYTSSFITYPDLTIINTTETATTMVMPCAFMMGSFLVLYLVVLWFVASFIFPYYLFDHYPLSITVFQDKQREKQCKKQDNNDNDDLQHFQLIHCPTAHSHFSLYSFVFSPAESFIVCQLITIPMTLLFHQYAYNAMVYSIVGIHALFNTHFIPLDVDLCQFFPTCFQNESKSIIGSFLNQVLTCVQLSRKFPLSTIFLTYLNDISFEDVYIISNPDHIKQLYQHITNNYQLYAKLLQSSTNAPSNVTDHIHIIQHPYSVTTVINTNTSTNHILFSAYMISFVLIFLVLQYIFNIRPSVNRPNEIYPGIAALTAPPTPHHNQSSAPKTHISVQATGSTSVLPHFFIVYSVVFIFVPLLYLFNQTFFQQYFALFAQQQHHQAFPINTTTTFTPTVTSALQEHIPSEFPVFSRVFLWLFTVSIIPPLTKLLNFTTLCANNVFGVKLDLVSHFDNAVTHLKTSISAYTKVFDTYPHFFILFYTIFVSIVGIGLLLGLLTKAKITKSGSTDVKSLPAQNSPSSGLQVPLIIIRKYYHILLLFIGLFPALVDIQCISAAFIGCLMLLLTGEIFRSFTLNIDLFSTKNNNKAQNMSKFRILLGDHLYHFFQKFSDKRDHSLIVMTHIYLLIGCALPLWCVMILASSIYNSNYFLSQYLKQISMFYINSTTLHELRDDNLTIQTTVALLDKMFDFSSENVSDVGLSDDMQLFYALAILSQYMITPSLSFCVGLYHNIKISDEINNNQSFNTNEKCLFYFPTRRLEFNENEYIPKSLNISAKHRKLAIYTTFFTPQQINQIGTQYTEYIHKISSSTWVPFPMYTYESLELHTSLPSNVVNVIPQLLNFKSKIDEDDIFENNHVIDPYIPTDILSTTQIPSFAPNNSRQMRVNKANSITPSPNNNPYNKLWVIATSGIIALGLGDTAATVAGKSAGYFAKKIPSLSFITLKWPQSDKSYIGTIGFIISTTLLIFLLSIIYNKYLQYYNYVYNIDLNIFSFIPLFQDIGEIVMVLLTSLFIAIIEATTSQIDNLILPLISITTYALFTDFLPQVM